MLDGDKWSVANAPLGVTRSQVNHNYYYYLPSVAQTNENCQLCPPPQFTTKSVLNATVHIQWHN